MATCTADEYYATLMALPDHQFLAGMSVTKDYKPFSVDQIGCMLKRYCRLTKGPKRAPRKKSSESVHVVYWITDKCDPKTPLYVGVTNSLAKRWRAHKAGSCQLAGIDDTSTLTITVVETIVGEQSDALKAESRHIRDAFLINPNLLNRTNPLRSSGGES